MVDRRRLPGIFGALALAACLGACEGSDQSHLVATAAPAPPQNTAAPPPPQSDATEGAYHIARDDLLDIAVFMVPSLSRTVQVDSKGRIDLPLLGSVVAGGRTARELEADIAQKLGSKYVRSPQVSVTVKDALAQRFAVDGAVLRPGVYVAKGDTTLLQVVAQAGGPNDVGDVDDVVIVRPVNGQRQAVHYSLRAIRKGDAPDPLVYGRDSVVVGESTTLNTLKFVKDVGAPVIGVARYAIP